MADIRIGVIGLGRMGALHAEHLAGSVRGARLVAAAVDAEHLKKLEASGGPGFTVSAGVQGVICDPSVDAVLIASPSSVHHEHIELAAAVGKPVFCEKPLADTVRKALDVASVVEGAGIPLQIGFQRRFDSGYVRAKELIDEGRAGRPELFRGVTCDRIPPVEYLRTSGGLFWDLGVHDFDAARFLMGDEIVAVHATGAIQVEPALAEFDDVDYGVVTLRFRGGALGIVQNSWRAPWGYEIRAEVYGSEGKVVTEVDERAPTRLYAGSRIVVERHDDFVERFSPAYLAELQAFVDAVRDGRRPSPDLHDALQALRAADAATRSLREHRWVEVDP